MQIGVMILAAGRGERMRPLSDRTPKPLIAVGGKPLIVWQIEGLARAGFRNIVINASHLAEQLIDRLDHGRAFGVDLRWSLEPEPLEVGGGIATALPLFPPGPLLVVSGDVWHGFDYSTVQARAARMMTDRDAARVHLVMVDNPPYHRGGDFALAGNRIALDGASRLTYGNIGLYDSALFRELPRGVRLKITPLYHQWIGRGLVSGEHYAGRWANVGTPEDVARLDAALQTNPADPPQPLFRIANA
jgi:MurNAc alpha-1-phosphate uridylyltransferase